MENKFQINIHGKFKAQLSLWRRFFTARLIYEINWILYNEKSHFYRSICYKFRIYSVLNGIIELHTLWLCIIFKENAEINIRSENHSWLHQSNAIFSNANNADTILDLLWNCFYKNWNIKAFNHFEWIFCNIKL